MIGRIRTRYGRTLAIAKQLREECEYNERKRATRGEAQQAIDDASDFVREAGKILAHLLSKENSN